MLPEMLIAPPPLTASRTNAKSDRTGYTAAFDYYELRNGLYRFGYYNCTKISSISNNTYILTG